MIEVIISFDLIDVFCSNKLCTFWDKDGIPLYRDQNHPSTHGAFMNPVNLNEGTTKLSKYHNLDLIINDILRA